MKKLFRKDKFNRSRNRFPNFKTWMKWGMDKTIKDRLDLSILWEDNGNPILELKPKK